LNVEPWDTLTDLRFFRPLLAPFPPSSETFEVMNSIFPLNHPISGPLLRKSSSLRPQPPIFGLVKMKQLSLLFAPSFPRRFSGQTFGPTFPTFLHRYSRPTCCLRHHGPEVPRSVLPSCKLLPCNFRLHGHVPNFLSKLRVFRSPASGARRSCIFSLRDVYFSTDNHFAARRNGGSGFLFSRRKLSCLSM